ncbi:hypothetical protein QYM36_019538 [Artemia franciscana]|uniref:Reverse transcriptase domain-containing protein n=1 Tax=Artemia franciscana TaxID=6661 RepID=A0AA88H741_ARTSF|nr:hypothetical protein QYM36_019538 [Artemia franciscana]
MVIYPMREHDYDLVGDVNGQEIKSIFKNLKGGTAAGVDGISILLFKNFLSILIPIIVLLCNKVLRSGQWPSAWKTSLFIPLFKRGNPKAHENYRLIALVPALSKVLEKILDTRLSNWLNTNNLIHEEQGGFRTGYGTTDSVFILKALIDKYGKGKTCLYVGFLDLHKAFDSVDRELLKDAMLNIGLPHSFVRLIVSMYTCVSGIIQVGNRFSKLFDIKRGVKQGSTLSPKLFNIFINDVVNFLENRWAPKVSLGTQKLSVLLFADDIALVANKPQDLQTLLNLIDEYLHIKKLRLNTEKSEVVILKKRKVGDDEKYTYYSTVLTHTGLQFVYNYLTHGTSYSLVVHWRTVAGYCCWSFIGVHWRTVAGYCCWSFIGELLLVTVAGVSLEFIGELLLVTVAGVSLEFIGELLLVTVA